MNNWINFCDRVPEEKDANARRCVKATLRTSAGIVGRIVLFDWIHPHKTNHKALWTQNGFIQWAPLSAQDKRKAGTRITDKEMP